MKTFYAPLSELAGIEQLKKDFDKWKKEAQAKIKLFKQGKLDEDALYKWMEENK